jgi:Bacterial Ig-like domain/FG-GAP-like repeat
MHQTIRRLLPITCLAVVALLAACGGGGGGGADSGAGGGGTVNPFTADYQPMSVGDRRFFRENAVITSTRVTGTRDTPFGTAFVVREDGEDGVVEDLVQRTAEGIWYLPNDAKDVLGTALGRLLYLRLPLVPGDSYEVVDRTLNNIADVDGDGRPDTLRVVIRVSISEPETLTVAGRTLTNVARVRTSVIQTFNLTTETSPFTGETLVEGWLVPDSGLVAVNTNTRVDGRLVLTGSATGLAWRVGGRPSDTVAPTVASVSPADGSVVQSASPRITFSEDIDRFTADGRAVLLVNASGVEAPATLFWLGEREVQVLPTTALAAGTWQLSLGSSLQDLAGNPVAAPPAWRITVDTSGPQSVSLFPAPGSTLVAANTAIRVVFDDALGDLSTAGPLFDVTTSLGGRFEGAVSREGDRTLVFKPTAELPPGQRVLVTLSGVPDRIGNPSARQTWSFDTAPGRFAAPVSLPSLISLVDGLTALDARAATDGSGRAELLFVNRPLGVTFDPVLYRLRFGADGSPGTNEALQTLNPDCTNTGLVLVDVDGDGVRDAVVSSASVTGVPAVCGVFALRGSADGSFAAPVALHEGSGGPVQALPHAAHGRPTLVMALDDARLLVLRQGAIPGTWLAPQYLPIAPTPLTGRSNPFLAVGDVNGDGRVDLVALERQLGSFVLERQVFLQTAEGTLLAPLRQAQPGTESATGLALGDLNGDGRADLVLEIDSALAWQAGGTDGTFGALQTLGDTTGAYAQRLADVDGDGLLDLLFWQHGSGLRVMSRLAGGGLGPAQTLLFGASPVYANLLAVADFDGDRLPDIATSSLWLRQLAPTGGTAASPAAATQGRAASAGASPQPADRNSRFGKGRLALHTERALRARSSAPGSP